MTSRARSAVATISCALPVLCALFLASVSSVATAQSTLQVVPASASDVGPRVAARGAESQLVMPYFRVTSNNSTVSLFALRNVTGSAVTVSSQFFLADGTDVAFEDDIAAFATLTINLRDLPLPSNGAVVEGMATFSVVDPGTTIPNGTEAILGDYFLVDPGNDFATGDPLTTDSEFCNRFNTRFADGGIFDGSSFNIVAPNFVAANAPNFDPGSGLADLFTASVYDEAGNLVDQFIGRASGIVFASSTSELETSGITLPQFGSIEWTFVNNQFGFISWSMNAAGRFSVGMLGDCLD